MQNNDLLNWLLSPLAWLLDGVDLGPLWLSFRLAAVTTAILLLIATPLAWWLTRSRSPMRPVIEAVTALPLVLPPTVLGFYLLVAFSPEAPLGRLVLTLTGETISFSFSGLVIASCLYSLPFAVQPLQTAFHSIGDGPLEAAASLGAGPFDRFVSIATPLALRGYLTAIVLSFAHTVGEFGVVLMVGGNLPGETRVVSIALYEKVELLDYASAHRISFILIAFALLILIAVQLVNRRFPVRAA